jgi:hypothetical protein
MAYFSTVAEYNTEIALVEGAIRRSLRLGAETGNSSGGSSRNNKEIALSELRDYKNELINERDALKGKTRATAFVPGW